VDLHHRGRHHDGVCARLTPRPVVCCSLCRDKRWTYAPHGRVRGHHLQGRITRYVQWRGVVGASDGPTPLTGAPPSLRVRSTNLHAYWRVSGHRLKLTHSRRTSGLWRGRFEMYGAFRRQGAGFEGSWLDVRPMVEGWRRGTGRAARRIAAGTGQAGGAGGLAPAGLAGRWSGT
jgi:hypothetical protein